MARKTKNSDATLITALARGLSAEEAAGEAKVSRRTVYRRLDDPEFARHVSAVRDEIWQRAVGSLADAATHAVATLRKLLDDGSPMARLGAARAILESGPRLREFVEHEMRLAAVESRVLGAAPMRVEYSDGWYGASTKAAEAAAASAERTAGLSEIKPPLGGNVNGTNGHAKGPL